MNTSTVRRLAGLALALVAAQVALVALFAWPSARAAPHHLPLVVAGPPGTATSLAAALGSAQPGGFTVTSVASASAATTALRERAAVGGVVATAGTGPTQVLVATAGSPAVATLLATVLPSALRHADPTAAVSVVDVVAPPSGDGHGAVPAAALVPLVVGSVACGALAALVLSTARARLSLVVTVAVLGGLATTAVLQDGLHALAGSYLANAGVLALVVGAVAATTAGLGGLARLPGVGAGLALTFLIGFPLSGASTSWRLLPPPWGVVGQAFPPGAGLEALRSVAFFDGHGATARLWALACWLVVGSLLLAGASWRTRPVATDG